MSVAHICATNSATHAVCVAIPYCRSQSKLQLVKALPAAIKLAVPYNKLHPMQQAHACTSGFTTSVADAWQMC